MRYVKMTTFVDKDDIKWLQPSGYWDDYQIKAETLCGPVFGFVSTKDLAKVLFPDAK